MQDRGGGSPPPPVGSATDGDSDCAPHDFDDQSFHSATSLAQSSSLLLDCSSSPLFRSAHSTLSREGGGDSDEDEAEVERGEEAEGGRRSVGEGAEYASCGVAAGHASAAEKAPAPSQAQSEDKTVEAGMGHWRIITDRTEVERPRVHHVSTNQDHSCVAIATDVGFRIRTIAPPRTAGAHAGEEGGAGGATEGATEGAAPNLVHQCHVPGGGVLLCAMWRTTSLLAVVRASSPRTLSLANAFTGRALRDLPFSAVVRRVDVGQSVLCVLTAEGRLHVFRLATLKLLRSVPVVHPSDPARWIGGAHSSAAGSYFAVTSDAGGGAGDADTDTDTDTDTFVVCRCRKRIGWVRTYRVTAEAGGGLRMRLVGSFQAHSEPVVKIAVGGVAQDRKIATASSRGTWVRIWSVPHGTGLQTLVRGTNSCEVHSLAFNSRADRLVLSSSTGTVHVFSLDGVGWGRIRHSPLRAVLHGAGASRNMAEGIRSYAKLKVKLERMDGAQVLRYAAFLGGDTAADEASSGKKLAVFVVSQQGNLYRFQIDDRGRTTQRSSEDTLLDDGNVVFNRT